MQAFEIHLGEHYGSRDMPKRADDLQHVKVLDQSPRQVEGAMARTERRAHRLRQVCSADRRGRRGRPSSRRSPTRKDSGRSATDVARAQPSRHGGSRVHPRFDW